MKQSHFASPIIVLVTSTLRPPGAADSVARQRRGQYEEALRSWLHHPDARIAGIVYCDNSSPDLEWARQLAEESDGTRAFEALYCPDNRIPAGMHYGYPELGIVDYCVRTSRLMERVTYFAKVTGRLRFPRFSPLLDRLPESFDACIDYRSAYRRERKSWTRYRARTQMMLFRNDFYRESLMDKRELMVPNGISHIEEFIAGILVPSDAKYRNCVFRWPIECRPSGIGGNGKSYDSGKEKLKSFVRGCARRFAPWLWI